MAFYYEPYSQLALLKTPHTHGSVTFIVESFCDSVTAMLSSSHVSPCSSLCGAAAACSCVFFNIDFGAFIVMDRFIDLSIAAMMKGRQEAKVVNTRWRGSEGVRGCESVRV